MRHALLLASAISLAALPALAQSSLDSTNPALALRNRPLDLGAGALTANGGGTLGGVFSGDATINLGTGALTVNGATLQASTPFTAPNLTIQLQALFLGTGAGASYPSFTSDSGYGPIGIGARSLNALNVAGQEDTCVGTVSCSHYTSTLTSGFGMDALGQEIDQPGDTDGAVAGV